MIIIQYYSILFNRVLRLDGLCGALHGVQAEGRLVFDLLGVLDGRALHRRGHGADPARQAGRVLLRRGRGPRVGLRGDV